MFKFIIVRVFIFAEREEAAAETLLAVLLKWMAVMHTVYSVFRFAFDVLLVRFVPGSVLRLTLLNVHLLQIITSIINAYRLIPFNNN